MSSPLLYRFSAILRSRLRRCDSSEGSCGGGGGDAGCCNGQVRTYSLVPSFHLKKLCRRRLFSLSLSLSLYLSLSAGLGSNGVSVTKFLLLLMILELYLELSYFFS